MDICSTASHAGNGASTQATPVKLEPKRPLTISHEPVSSPAAIQIAKIFPLFRFRRDE
jgi:hypothetical protein